MILLTRPYEQSAALAVLLGEENCVIAPVMKIEKVGFEVPENTQAIISTSKNVSYDVDIKIPDQGKTAREIMQYCIDNLRPENGKIVYLSGDDVTLDIAAELEQKGYDAERVIAYKQVAAAKAEIDFEAVTIVTFFSLNSLKIFLDFYSETNLSHITCVCISDKLSEVAKSQSWKDVVIATEPDLAGMIDAIARQSYV